MLLQLGCGYIGGPLPPLANIPSAVKDLAAVQRGGTIIVQFSVPLRTTEDMPIREPLKLDVRIGPRPVPFSPAQWESTAKREPERTESKGIARYDIPVGPWTGKQVAIGARVIGENGKASDWSNFAVVDAVPPPDVPKDLRAEPTTAGMRLTWNAKGEHFRVLRKGPGETQYSIVATDVRQNEWTDLRTTVGAQYSYIVQTYVPQTENREAQSDLSGEFPVTAQAPPPSTPAGLLAVPGPNSIELSWDGNSDGVTTGYRIYRAAADGAFERLAEAGVIPTYSDRAVEHGKTYRYTVSALDKDGRESGRSTAVAVPYP